MSLLGTMLDPTTLIDKVGLVGVIAIVFAESGMLVGFFLPGDSLLFTAGFLATRPSAPGLANLPHPNIVVLVIGSVTAAIAGDQIGYMFGRKVGPALFNRPDSRFFKQKNVQKAQQFFEKYGSKTIVLARFVPVVRTFTPVLAGASRMNYRTFVLYNVLGGVGWGAGACLLGYYLGQVDIIANHVQLAVLAVVAISLVPIVVELLLSRRRRQTA